MEDHAGDLGDRAADRIENFFGRVEDMVEDRSDSVRREASRKAEGMRQEVGQARRQGEAEAKRAEQAAHAKSEDAAQGHAAQQAAAHDDAAHSEDAAAQHAADEKKPGGDAVALAGAGTHPAASAVLGLCALVTLSFGAFFLLSLRSRTAIRESPLLG